jgi:hypothetical protein
LTDLDYLVPDRTCGSCTTCCKDLAIIEDGMNKLPGVLCSHCTAGAGCAIYETRPNVCRTYHCLWRRLPNMADDWRPDLSGVLIMPAKSLEGSPSPIGVEILLTGSPEILKDDRFASMLAGFIDSETPTTLMIRPDVGFLSPSIPLNQFFAEAIAARDLPRVKAMIWDCYIALKDYPSTPISAEHMLPPASS